MPATLRKQESEPHGSHYRTSVIIEVSNQKTAWPQ
jgi:hypothetical protein